MALEKNLKQGLSSVTYPCWCFDDWGEFCKKRSNDYNSIYLMKVTLITDDSVVYMMALPRDKFQLVRRRPKLLLAN